MLDDSLGTHRGADGPPVFRPVRRLTDGFVRFPRHSD